MGKGPKPPTPAKPAAVAVPSEIGAQSQQRSMQQQVAKRKKQQKTIYAGGDSVGSRNVLG